MALRTRRSFEIDEMEEAEEQRLDLLHQLNSRDEKIRKLEAKVTTLEEERLDLFQRLVVRDDDVIKMQRRNSELEAKLKAKTEFDEILQRVDNLRAAVVTTRQRQKHRSRKICEHIDDAITELQDYLDEQVGYHDGDSQVIRDDSDEFIEVNEDAGEQMERNHSTLKRKHDEMSPSLERVLTNANANSESVQTAATPTPPAQERSSTQIPSAPACEDLRRLSEESLPATSPASLDPTMTRMAAPALDTQISTTIPATHPLVMTTVSAPPPAPSPFTMIPPKLMSPATHPNPTKWTATSVLMSFANADADNSQDETGRPQGESRVSTCTVIDVVFTCSDH